MNQPLRFSFTGDGMIPNSKLPLLVYRHAVPADPAAIERIFAANHWPPAWRNGVYAFHHFHSRAHEVLGIARGQVRVLFGGPGGQVLDAAAGDVIVIPAGVGHCSQGQTDDLLIVGAYPDTGPAADTRRGLPAEYEDAAHAAAAVPLPVADPVQGPGGALTELWAAVRLA